jgi:hypothetical protein
MTAVSTETASHGEAADPVADTDAGPYILAGLVVVLIMFGGLGTW